MFLNSYLLNYTWHYYNRSLALSIGVLFISFMKSINEAEFLDITLYLY